MNRTTVTRNLPAWALALAAVVVPDLAVILQDALDAALAAVTLPETTEAAIARIALGAFAYGVGYFGVQRGTVPVDPRALSHDVSGVELEEL